MAWIKSVLSISTFTHQGAEQSGGCHGSLPSSALLSRVRSPSLFHFKPVCLALTHTKLWALLGVVLNYSSSHVTWVLEWEEQRKDKSWRKRKRQASHKMEVLCEWQGLERSNVGLKLSNKTDGIYTVFIFDRLKDHTFHSSLMLDRYSHFSTITPIYIICKLELEFIQQLFITNDYTSQLKICVNMWWHIKSVNMLHQSPYSWG